MHCSKRLWNETQDAEQTIGVARRVKRDDMVWVPWSRIGADPGSESCAFAHLKVERVHDRSVFVTPPGGTQVKIASSAVQTNLGVLIVRIGDCNFGSEAMLLGPLSKSVLQHCRLLLRDDMVFHLRVRSVEELRRFWVDNHWLVSHLIVVGHGSENGLTFGVDGRVDPATFAAALTVADVEPKVILSLACRTGRAGFAKALSRSTPVASAVVGPLDPVHGAVASQFSQTFLAHHLLAGSSLRVAFKNAKAGVPTGAVFRMWAAGQHV